ncbi:MAG: hypothetical protein ACXW2Q_04455, partial [Thermoanaerobaculia bacterium]
MIKQVLACAAAFVVVAATALGDVWSRSFKVSTFGTFSDIALSRDGGVQTILQTLGGPCIVRLSRAGAAIEGACYGGTNENNGGHFAFSPDGFFVYGQSFKQPSPHESAFVFHFDAHGKLLWARRYAAEDDVTVVSAAATADGGLILAGSVGRIIDQGGVRGEKALAFKLDRAGKIEWQRTFDTSETDGFTSVRIVSDGMIVAGGAGFGGWAYKLRNSGEVQWRRLLPNRYVDAIALLPGGDLGLAGSVIRDDVVFHWIARLDARGHVKWERYGNLPNNWFTHLFAGLNDELVAYSQAMAVNKQNVTGIAKFGAEGKLMSSHTVAYGLERTPAAMAGTPDGGVVTLLDWGQRGVDVYKLDRDARVPSCLTAAKLEIAFQTMPAERTAFTYPIEELRGALQESEQIVAQRSITVTALAECAPSAAAPAAQAKPAAEPKMAPSAEEKRAFDNDVKRMVEEKRFEALDRLGSELRKSREPFSDGFIKAVELHQVLSAALSFGGEQKHLGLLEEWRRRMPTSATASIAAANAYVEYAFVARGGGLGGTVTESASRKFDRLTTKASAILDEASAFANGDPEYDLARASAFSLTSCSRLLQFAYDKDVAQRRYVPTFARIANFLLPRWCGSPDEYRKFAEFAAQSMEPERADEVYGRLGFYALSVEVNSPIGEPTPFFAAYQFDWNRMKRGLRDFIHRQPGDAERYQMLAFSAWKAGDRPVAREMFERPELAWTPEREDVWRGSAFYDQARDWSKSQSEAWVPGVGEEWPPIVMRSSLMLNDGTEYNNFHSFLVETPDGVRAISALRQLDIHVPQYGALEALPLAQLRSKLASWTMAAPSAPGNRLTVASIEPIALRDQPFSPIRGAVLKLGPTAAALPVQILKIRSTPTKLRDRAYVVGCAPAR